MFDRTGEYVAIIKKVDAMKRKVALDASTFRKEIKKIKSEFEAVAAVDFFPGEPRDQAATALADVETRLAAMLSPGEPRPAKGRIRKHDVSEFKGRLWATRRGAWVDRLASAWLIKRFIDPKAKFIWLENMRKAPAGAVGFDFDGAAGILERLFIPLANRFRSIQRDRVRQVREGCRGVHVVCAVAIRVRRRRGAQVLDRRRIEATHLRRFVRRVGDVADTRPLHVRRRPAGHQYEFLHKAALAHDALLGKRDSLPDVLGVKIESVGPLLAESLQRGFVASLAAAVRQVGFGHVDDRNAGVRVGLMTGLP